jgi:glycosyltransferase involved in cell wall biosynthesis
MARTNLYYHRIRFPLDSGQTIQVLRDYHAVAMQGDKVYLFYRADKALSISDTQKLFDQCGLPWTDQLQFYWIPEGMFGKRRLRQAAQTVARLHVNDSIVLACRTVDHALAALRLRRRLTNPATQVVLELHETAIPHMIYQEMGRPWRARFSRYLERVVFHRVDGIIATVGSQLTLLDKLYPRHARSIVLPNGVPVRFFERSPHPTADSRYHLRYAGQLMSWKNTDILVELLQHLPAHVVLDVAAGKLGKEAETQSILDKAAEKFGVVGRVSYVGCLAPAAVSEFLYGADALLVPLGENISSRHFTCPMKLFEYAATGIPMVVTRQPTTMSLITHGRHALMVEPCSAKAIAQAVEQLIADPSLARQLGENARAWAQENTYDQRATRLRGFLDTLGRAA